MKTLALPALLMARKIHLPDRELKRMASGQITELLEGDDFHPSVRVLCIPQGADLEGDIHDHARCLTFCRVLSGQVREVRYGTNGQWTRQVGGDPVSAAGRDYSAGEEFFVADDELHQLVAHVPHTTILEAHLPSMGHSILYKSTHPRGSRTERLTVAGEWWSKGEYRRRFGAV